MFAAYCRHTLMIAFRRVLTTGVHRSYNLLVVTYQSLLTACHSLLNASNLSSLHLTPCSSLVTPTQRLLTSDCFLLVGHFLQLMMHVLTAHHILSATTCLLSLTVCPCAYVLPSNIQLLVSMWCYLPPPFLLTTQPPAAL